MTHDIHSTVYPTRTMTSATPSPVQDNTQNQGDLGLAWRTTADGTREQAGHALLRDRRLRPDRHPQHQRARGQGVSLGLLRRRSGRAEQDDIHSMQNKAEYVFGYRLRGRDQVRECTQGCERDRDGRAACRGLRERPHHIHEQVAQLPPRRLEADTGSRRGSVSVT